MMQIGSRLYDTSARILHFAVLGAKLFGGAWTLDALNAVGAETVSESTELPFASCGNVKVGKLVMHDRVAFFALGLLERISPTSSCLVDTPAVCALDE
jgi:hypothetical protein